MNTRKITLHVELDDNHLPTKLSWTASDSDQGPKECKAFLLALWDQAEATTMRIDLWTKDMRVDEMNRLFHQSLVTMAETFQRATGNTAVAEDLKGFASKFAGKTGITGSPS
jgi:gliding motility-associated protein GldC